MGIYDFSKRGRADNSSYVHVSGYDFINAPIGASDPMALHGSACSTDSICNDNTYCTATTRNVYFKDEHESGGVGANRTLDKELESHVNRVFLNHWALPEYAFFREGIKMAIQDGIKCGQKDAADKYEKKLSDAINERDRWKNAFTNLYTQCRVGIHAFDAIRRVVKSVDQVNVE